MCIVCACVKVFECVYVYGEGFECVYVCMYAGRGCGKKKPVCDRKETFYLPGSARLCCQVTRNGPDWTAGTQPSRQIGRVETGRRLVFLGGFCYHVTSLGAATLDVFSRNLV